MRLILVEDDGTVLDSVENLSREEFRQAQRSALDALSLVEQLEPGEGA